VRKTISKIGGTCSNIQLPGGDVFGEFFSENNLEISPPSPCSYYELPKSVQQRCAAIFCDCKSNIVSTEPMFLL